MTSATPEERRANSLLDVQTIYVQQAARAYPRAQEILARFPEADQVEVDSHWNIPEVHGNADLAPQWNRVKRTHLILGVKKGLKSRPNGRSADFIAPSHANGCAMACAYCYVPRRKGFANPITTFVNIEEIKAQIARDATGLGMKFDPNQCDEEYWTFDIGENCDCSVDATISDNVRDLVALFRTLPTAKGTFATKFVNRDLLDYDPQGKTRIRFSLMPAHVAKVVDVRTSPVLERIRAIDDFVRAGWEVHVNLSPIIVYDGWQDDYRELLRQLRDLTDAQSKAQLKAEAFFLTHNQALHEVNLQWHPKGEAYLWRPEIQEDKPTPSGGVNRRYRMGLKRGWMEEFRRIMAEEAPYCPIRYLF